MTKPPMDSIEPNWKLTDEGISPTLRRCCGCSFFHDSRFHAKEICGETTQEARNGLNEWYQVFTMAHWVHSIRQYPTDSMNSNAFNQLSSDFDYLIMIFWRFFSPKVTHNHVWVHTSIHITHNHYYFSTDTFASIEIRNNPLWWLARIIQSLGK